MDMKFKYEVHPRIPIRNLIPQQAIIRPTQLDLTKDDVKLCLQHGPVFRVFDRQTQVKVTIYNLDELHVAKYNAPAPNAVKDPAKKTDVIETIVIPKAEEAVPAPAPVEEAPAPVEEPAVEEAPAEEPVVEESVKEEAPVEEAPTPIPEISNLVEEHVAPAPVEEAPVEEAVSEAPVEEPVEETESTESSEEAEAVESTEDEAEEGVEDDEEDEEDDVEDSEVNSAQPSNGQPQYHPKKKKRHH